MGRLLARVFARNAWEVLIHDPAGGVPGFASVPFEAARTADVVLISAPLAHVARVTENVVALAPRGLVADIGSVKAPVVPILRKAAKRGLAVASLHPLFGPGVPGLEGRDLMVLDAGNPAATRRTARLFAGTGLRIKTLPIEEHDPWIARTMGLAHVVALVAASTLARGGVVLEGLDGRVSTSFRRLLDLVTPLLAQAPDLTHAIQSENPEALRVFEMLAEEVGAVGRLMKDPDPAPFAERLTELRSALSRRERPRKR